MKKQSERTPEEIAKDLENIDFAEIEAEDLREVLGGLRDSGGDTTVNSNCCC